MPPAPPSARSPSWFLSVWASVGSILTIIGALSRTDLSCIWFTLCLAYPWPDKLPVIWGMTVPLILGLVTLSTLWMRRGRTCGVFLTVPVLLALFSYLVASFFSDGRGALLALLGIIL